MNIITKTVIDRTNRAPLTIKHQSNTGNITLSKDSKTSGKAVMTFRSPEEVRQVVSALSVVRTCGTGAALSIPRLRRVPFLVVKEASGNVTLSKAGRTPCEMTFTSGDTYQVTDALQTILTQVS
jgi:hypothetical protein